MYKEIAKLASYALYAELTTYPKPGLVSLIDSGSHKDMDYATFIKSINCLQSYFEQIAQAGANRAPFTALIQLGQDAEAAMLLATDGINTHRGAIFILGLLVAANAASKSYDNIQTTIIHLWGNDLLSHQGNGGGNGAKIRKQYALQNNIILEAANGFPLIFCHVEDYARSCREVSIKDARIITFMRIMQELDDTNLIHRGGIDGLNYAKTSASAVLHSYALDKGTLFAKAKLLHQKFIQRNLSPGGVADVLAGVIFLHAVKQDYLGFGVG